MAEQLNVELSTVGRWERRIQSPQPWMRPRLAKALGLSADELGDILADASPATESSTGESVKSDHDGVMRDGEQPEQNNRNSAGDPPIGRRRSLGGFAAFALPEDWLVVSDRRRPANFGRSEPLNRRIGSSDVEALREMTSLFLHADQRRGGGHGRSAVMEYLNSDVTAQLNGVYADEQTRSDMFSAAGELAYLVGWMAFDDSDHALAKHYFVAAVKLANEADDPPLAGHVLRAMAHQALDLGLSAQAHDLATASIEGDRYDRASPRERSLLGVIYARSLVARGETQTALSVLLQAEDDLSNAGTAVPEPERVFFFSEASLAHETACALRDLGDLSGANENFQRSIELRDASRFTRTHAVTLGYLGDVKAHQGRMDEACAVWSKSLSAMQGVRSGRARRVVAEMRAKLLPLSGEDSVARELEYMAIEYLADSSPG